MTFNLTLNYRISVYPYKVWTYCLLIIRKGEMEEECKRCLENLTVPSTFSWQVTVMGSDTGR